MATESKSSSTKKLLSALLVVVWLAATAFLGYKFYDLRKQNKSLNDQLSTANQEIETYRANPQEAANAEVRKYVEAVGKLYSLPADEQPSVATVSDKEKLKDQPFFANAENGDVTLIYTNAKLAILYRPSTNQIVNVSSVTIQETKPTN